MLLCVVQNEIQSELPIEKLLLEAVSDVLLNFCLEAVYGFLLLHFAGYVLFLLISTVAGFHEVCNQEAAPVAKCEKKYSSGYYPPLSIIVPAYNEEVTIVSTIHSLLALQYDFYEIIVVDDGSKDKTAEKVIKSFGLSYAKLKISKVIPCQSEIKSYWGTFHNKSQHAINLILIQKINGGKADALNMGINVASYPLFVCIDADSILQFDALTKIVEPLLCDDKVVAVGGWICPCNDLQFKNGRIEKYHLPQKTLACMQVFEYARSFLGARVLLDKFNGSLIISGAFGLFRKEVVIAAGGYDASNIGEDMELVMKLHEYCLSNYKPYRIRYTINAVCWTQVPDRFIDLYKQRKRWSIGLAQCMRKYRHIPDRDRIEFQCFNMAYIYFLFYELLSPYIELLGIIVMVLKWRTNSFNASFIIALTLYFITCSLIFSISIFFEQICSYGLKPDWLDLLKAFFLSLFEAFVMRPCMVWIRFWSVMTNRRQNKQWGCIKRRAITVKSDSLQPAVCVQQENATY